MKPRDSALSFGWFAVRVFIVALLCAGCDGSDRTLDSAKDKDLDRRLRENMRVVQIAAEHYAADRAGQQYPMTIDSDFRTYFPGGVDGSRASSIGPINPFSGTNEFPVLGSESDIKVVSAGGDFPIEPGEIRYAPLEGGASYAIVGGAHNGRVLMDEHNPDQILILSNK